MTTSNENALPNEATITKKDLNRLFVRSITTEGSFNYERQHNLGFAYALIPVLEKLYKKKEDLSAALTRHMEYYNTTPMLNPFVVGVATAMEEENAKDENFDSSSISKVKASLMGPLAGIGDSFFHGTLKTIATGIGCSFALSGNVLGTILFLLIFNIPNYLCRFFGLQYGYKLGTSFLGQASASGVLQKVFLAASIIGMTVIGGMVSSMIKVELPWTIGAGESAVTFTEMINGIMPNMLSLALTFLVLWLLNKKVKPDHILIGIMVISILGCWIGIF